MGIGNYKQIMLVKKVPVKDTNGNWATDTETKYDLWAEVIRKAGDRIYKDGQTQVSNFVQFRVRFQPALNPDVDWKIIYAGRKHAVHSIERDKEKRFHWIINAQSVGDK